MPTSPWCTVPPRWRSRLEKNPAFPGGDPGGRVRAAVFGGGGKKRRRGLPLHLDAAARFAAACPGVRKKARREGLALARERRKAGSTRPDRGAGRPFRRRSVRNGRRTDGDSVS